MFLPLAVFGNRMKSEQIGGKVASSSGNDIEASQNVWKTWMN